MNVTTLPNNQRQAHQKSQVYCKTFTYGSNHINPVRAMGKSLIDIL